MSGLSNVSDSYSCFKTPLPTPLLYAAFLGASGGATTSPPVSSIPPSDSCVLYLLLWDRGGSLCRALSFQEREVPVLRSVTSISEQGTDPEAMSESSEWLCPWMNE